MSQETCDHMRHAFTAWHGGNSAIESGLPTQATIDRFGHFWANLQIVRAAEHAGFTYHFVGSHIQGQLGADITGRRVGSRLRPIAFAVNMIQGFSWVRENARPLFTAARYRPREGEPAHVCRLLVPIGTAAPANFILVARTVRPPHLPDPVMQELPERHGIMDCNQPIDSAEELERLIGCWLGSDTSFVGDSG